MIYCDAAMSNPYDYATSWLENLVGVHEPYDRDTWVPGDYTAGFKDDTAALSESEENGLPCFAYVDAKDLHLDWQAVAKIRERADTDLIERALALYDLGQTTYALDEFIHPLVDKLMVSDFYSANSMLRAVKNRIRNYCREVGAQSISEQSPELEMWLASVTITQKVAPNLSERQGVVEALRSALAESSHSEKDALLRFVM